MAAVAAACVRVFAGFAVELSSETIRGTLSRASTQGHNSNATMENAAGAVSYKKE